LHINKFFQNAFFAEAHNRNSQSNFLLNTKNIFCGKKKIIKTMRLRKNNFISKNIEDYKISGEIFSEFVRLSWKSYWFQTNFQPYVQRITQNFQKMKQIEGKKSFDQYNFFHFFENQPFQNIGFESLDSQQNLLLRKSIFKKFLWYLNFQSSLQSNSAQTTSSNFQQFQNLSEYNRILYSRVSKILAAQRINMKSLDNNNEEFYLKTLKTPKRNNEDIFRRERTNRNFSFFTKAALFCENFSIPKQSVIPAFSLFSSLFHNFSIKPSGELPTLRALWAYQQTNLLNFQESNNIRNLWTLKKRTVSFHNLKGTKKILSIFRKFSSLEKINISLFKNFVFSQSKEKPFVFESKNKVKTFGFTKKTLDSFLISNVQSEFHEFLKNLDNMSFQKFQNVETKSSLFGFKSLKQNSKLSLRYLRFHLISSAHPYLDKQCKNSFFHAQKLKSAQDQKLFRKLDKDLLFQFEMNPSLFNIKKANPLNSAKSSLNYWWTQKNLGAFKIFMGTNRIPIPNAIISHQVFPDGNFLENYESFSFFLRIIQILF